MIALALPLGVVGGAFVPSALGRAAARRGLTYVATPHERLLLALMGGLLAMAAVLSQIGFLAVFLPLLAAAEADRRWGIIPTEFVLAMVMAGLLSARPFLLSLAAGAVVYLALLLVALVGRGGVGMGDVRLSAAAVFALGAAPGLAALVIGHLLALLSVVTRSPGGLLGRRVRMGPWFLAGAVLASLAVAFPSHGVAHAGW